MQKFVARKKPLTVTRGLPNYVIGKDYQRLVRLVREYQHMDKRHSYESRRLIEMQCEKLHYKVYKEICYYGALPSCVYAYDSKYM